MRSTKIIKNCSSSLCTCLHHMVIIRTRNKITDFVMILAWASPFNECIQALYIDITSSTIVIIILITLCKYCLIMYNCHHHTCPPGIYTYMLCVYIYLMNKLLSYCLTRYLSKFIYIETLCIINHVNTSAT